MSQRTTGVFRTSLGLAALVGILGCAEQPQGAPVVGVETADAPGWVEFEGKFELRWPQPDSEATEWNVLQAESMATDAEGLHHLTGIHAELCGADGGRQTIDAARGTFSTLDQLAFVESGLDIELWDVIATSEGNRSVMSHLRISQ